MLPRLQPFASRLGSCRLPAGCFLVLLPKPEDSPHELHLSLRALESSMPCGISPDPSNSPVLEVPTRLQVPLLRSLAPPAHQAKSVYQPRDYLPRFVPPTPFSTTLTVYSAPCRSRVLHRVTLMGFLPSRVTPDWRGKLRFRNFLPLMALARRLRLEQGLKEPMPPC